MKLNERYLNFRSIIMIYLLYIAIIYILFTGVIFYRNLCDFKNLRSVKIRTAYPMPKVSICIPARNEEDVIERCVTSALKQNYPDFEVLVLDDQSTDNTTAILQKLSGIIHNLSHLEGSEKPKEWLGKPWACHQLSQHAKGDILIFIDADVWLEENSVSKCVSAMHHESVDAITVWPQQHLHGFWEKAVIPHIYYALYTLLPAAYVERNPRWMPSSFQERLGVEFSAACGQFIAFRREAYDSIGGHTCVKDKIVEDVSLARALKSRGEKIKMYGGRNEVHCRMYQTPGDMFAGLRKNFFIGFKKSVALFLIMAFIHLIVFILPFFSFVYAIIIGNDFMVLLSLIIIIFYMANRYILNRIYKWDAWEIIMHPVGVIWYQVLGLFCLFDHFSGKKVSWKGRDV